jgi:hypothetical protein
VLRTIHQVGRAFCLATEAWRLDLPAIDLVADQALYTLDTDLTPPEPEVIRVTRLRISSVDYYLDSFSVVSPVSPATQFQVRLVDEATPAVAVTDGLEVQVALAPYVTDDNLPADFQNRWSDTLTAGVLSRLLAYDPRRFVWGDLERAAMNAQVYTRGVAEARREKVVARRSGTASAVPREGWAI